MRGRVQQHALWQGDTPLAWDAALTLMADSPEFRDLLTRLIADSPFTALRWETPPITHATVGRPFEFVLVEAPGLDMSPEPEVFGPHFEAEPPDVTVKAVQNLGRTAWLVVPRATTTAHRDFVHLRAFVRGAPPGQVHALWRLVAHTARRALSDRRLWVSTAGGGVSWLHVRLEGVPKYYAYRPYATMA